MRIATFLFFFFLANQQFYGQNRTEILSQELEQLFSRIRPDTDDSSKVRIADSVNMYLHEFANSENVFSHRFDNIRNLGQITSPDSLLKILCWNLPLEFPAGKYFCYIVRKTPAQNRIYKLFSDYNQEPVDNDALYTQDNWYGALYYDARPFVDAGKRYYVVLGLDYGNPLITRKIIDVIHFNDSEELLLGKKWFDNEGETSSRLVFEYSAAATMSLRFNSDTSIVFDHLVPFSPELAGNKQYYAPDFSFDSYSFSDGIWKFSSNVDVRNID